MGDGAYGVWLEKLQDVMQVLAEYRGYKNHYDMDYSELNNFMGWQTGARFIVNYEDPEVRHAIDAVHGPHCLTLLKVIKARKENAVD